MSSLPPLNDRCALFLDIDGTLLDIASQPDAVIVPERTIPTLVELRDWLGGAFALVSGRDLESIESLFGSGFDMAGSHGHEWRVATVGTAVTPQVSAALLAAIEEVVQRVREFPGLVIERKSHSLAVHYRLAPEHKEAAKALADLALQRLGTAYRLQYGKAVIEVVPVGAGKGTAIERFMSFPPYRGRRPVFAGDDLSDESGFEAVNRLGGISIRVGESADTTANYVLASPTALRIWLDNVQYN